MWTSSSSNGPRRTFSPALQHLEGGVTKPVLLELRAHQADRQRAAVDHRRHSDLAQDVGQRPDVILVPMGEDDRLDVVGVIAEIGEVRQHQVDSQHLGGREHQPGVDHDDPPVLLDDGHVLADLAQPPERQDAKWSRQPGGALARRQPLPHWSPTSVVPPATRRPCRSSAVLTAARSSLAGGNHRQPQMAFDDAQHLERRLDRDRVAGHRGRLVDRLKLRVELVSAGPFTCDHGLVDGAHLRPDQVRGDQDAAGPSQLEATEEDARRCRPGGRARRSARGRRRWPA